MHKTGTNTRHLRQQGADVGQLFACAPQAAPAYISEYQTYSHDYSVQDRVQVYYMISIPRSIQKKKTLSCER